MKDFFFVWLNSYRKGIIIEKEVADGKYYLSMV